MKETMLFLAFVPDFRATEAPIDFAAFDPIKPVVVQKTYTQQYLRGYGWVWVEDGNSCVGPNCPIK